MDSQETLDKWIMSCLNYYNKNSNKEMKTTEERFQQLEQAHGRMYNSFNTLHTDFVNYRRVMQEELEKLQQLVNSLQPKEEEVQELPETLVHNKDYTGVIAAVIKSTPTKWNNKDWTNWELKLEGKEDYAFVAFIPTEHQLTAGDKVKFQYVHPFQLKKLKQL